jgi:succinate dehydrogenase/fumarate reductase flavoprotein subunit
MAPAMGQAVGGADCKVFPPFEVYGERRRWLHKGRDRGPVATTITRLITDGSAGDGGCIAGAFGYFRDTGRFAVFEAPAVVLATGGIGKTFKVTSNSWEYTGDGHALALRAGATLLNMEFVQFPPHPHGLAAVGGRAAGHRVGAQ